MRRTQVGSKNQNDIYPFGYRKPRFDLNFSVLLQIDAQPPRVIDARCINISEDGIAIAAIEELVVGSVVTVVMTAPNSSQSIRIPAKVNSRDEKQYGFVFLFPSEIERQSLQTYLSSIRPEPIRLSRTELA